jgi:hypothetical protein
MIKILIVLEEEDGIDFRAYALQVSNKANGLPSTAKLLSIENDEEMNTAGRVSPSSPELGPEVDVNKIGYRIGQPLNKRQIFMN